MPSPTAEIEIQSGARMPLSGEAIRMMNYVDDIAVTLRRIQAVLPSLTEEERIRVSDYIRKSEPNYDSVLNSIVEEPALK